MKKIEAMDNRAGRKLLAALAGQAQAVPPVWLMRQAGRHLPEYRQLRARAGSFMAMCFTPQNAIEATLQPVRRYGMDGAILFSDILVIPHALGQTLEVLEGIGPRLPPLAELGGLAALNRTGMIERLAPVYEAAAGVAAALPPEAALIGFAGAPWTLACYMIEGKGSRDFEKARRMPLAQPGEFAGLMALLTELVAEHLCAQIEAGCQAVQIFDSWAGILSEADFDRFVIAPTARITRLVKARHPDVPIIGFPRGAGAQALAYARGAGVDALSLDWTQPIGWAAANIQPLMPVQGHLDPLLLAEGGAPMLAAADRILDGFAGGGHVFNLGHGVIKETPPENVVALLDHIRRRV